MLKRGIHRSSFPEKAQGMVEFALVFPILLVLIYGIIEFGRLLFIYSSVTTASREAARYGSAVNRVGGNTPQYLDCAGILNAARRAAILTPINASNVSIRYDHGPGTATIATSCPAAQDQNFVLGDRIVVQVTVPYSPLLPLVNFASFNVTSTTGRTILKAVEVQGTPVASLSEPYLYFVTEAEEGVEQERREIRVILDGIAINNITVEFEFTGTATPGADYTIKYTTLNIPQGTLSGTIFAVAQVEDDLLDEYDETIIARILSINGAKTKEPTTHTMTILDTETDDPLPEVGFLASQTSVDEGGESRFIEVGIISPPYASGKDVQASLVLPHGGIASASDYTLSKVSFTIPAGASSDRTMVTALQDNLYEGTVEDVILTLNSAPVNAVLSSDFMRTVHTVFITDTDQKPKVSFDLPSQMTPEGVTLRPKLVLDKISALDTSVSLLAVNETAFLNSDYQLPVNNVTIPAGSQEATINVPILMDAEVESNETFRIVIDTVTNADKGVPSEHVVTINDNTAPPEVSFESSGKSVSEGDGVVRVRIQLDHVWNQPVTVPYSVIGGTAVQGLTNDYTIAGNQVVIPVGSLYENIEITLVDDPTDEFNETIILALGSPTNATKGTPNQFVITIVDNDPEPEIFFSVPLQSAPENAGSVTVEVRLALPSAKDVSASVLVSGNATEGQDFTMPTKSISIPAGSTTAVLTINIIDDTVPSEGNERAILTLVNPVNAIVGAQNTNTTTIMENDFCPYISTWDVRPNQGYSTMQIGFTYSENQPTIYITEIDVWWNDSKGQLLDRLEWIGKTIYDPKPNVGSSPTFITSFIGTLADRQYPPTSLERFMLIYFKNALGGLLSDYDLTVRFDNGCVVTP